MLAIVELSQPAAGSPAFADQTEGGWRGRTFSADADARKSMYKANVMCREEDEATVKGRRTLLVASIA